MTERANRGKAPTQRIRLAIAAIGLAVVLGAMAVGIALTHAESKSRILTSFKARGVTSAEFISTYLAQQGVREAHPVAGSVLETFVEHAVSSKPHLVTLVDAGGKIITASPRIAGATLHQAAPRLGNAVAHATHGEITLAGTPNTFVVAPVAGTPWRLVTALPNAHLFASISGWAQWLPWIVFAVIALLGLIALFLLARSLSANALLESLTTELAHAARTDPVTGLANRRSLDERVAQASAYANRYDEPLSALLIDLDNFKQINDTYGHDMGDEALRAVSECMRTIFRDSDIFGRWGGDEFLAVLPGPHPDVTGSGERLCAEVRALDVSRFGMSSPLTVSVGCASATDISPQELLVAADNALYRAKAAGRDRVEALV